MAKCPCDHSNKNYYDCCWADTAEPCYLNDRNGMFANKLSGIKIGYRDCLRTLFGANIRDDGLTHISRFFSETSDTVGTVSARRTAVVNKILDSARNNPNLLVDLDGPTSRLSQWDVVVYAGCVARLDRWFLWKSNHWNLDQTELLKRVDDWNQALEKYCDDMEMVGEERDRVIQTHTASPLAHCGCPGCERVEEEVRGFKRCSRCRAVAYCSPECQRLDWPAHKPMCKG